MRIKSPETKARLLQVAEQEFLRHGFRAASLRRMARRAGASTGILYTYFESKDDIFAQLVRPAVTALEARLASEEPEFARARQETGFRPERWFTRNLRFLIELIDRHPVAMKLLFLNADGSAFADYQQSLIDRGTRRSAAVFQRLPRASRFKDQELSLFFVRNLVWFVLHITGEILRQDSGPADIARYEAEVGTFLFRGWKGLVRL